MHPKFLNYFFDPVDKARLDYFDLESTGTNLGNGIFINPSNGNCYPLMNGVPVFLPDFFDSTFVEKFSIQIPEFKKKFPNARLEINKDAANWSFSSEWDAHDKKNMDTTWGMTTAGRYEQFLLETQTSEEDLKGKKVLDAGCGNGMLTQYISVHGAVCFGFDFSGSVFSAERKRTGEDVCYVRGDLQQPPFAAGVFDIIVSNGVLHHTPDTEFTFKKVAETVKPQGKFYMWLYSRKGSLAWRFKRRVFDIARVFVSRMPASVQKIFVNIFAGILLAAYRIFGKKLDYETLLIDMYDSITPRWRHYHTPDEVSRWYFESGFGPVTLTNWNTLYGFGLYASKTPMEKTPGADFRIKNS